MNKRGEVNISHILDFSSSSHNHRARQQQQQPRRPPARNNRPVSAAQQSNDPPPDKDTYVNVSCKFVLDPRGDYRPLLLNPDMHVPMENVLRIITQATSCPICLEDVPEAPRMLPCGHVMCYPCLLRFINSSPVIPAGETKPKKHKECPLCFERVAMNHVKPVSFALVNEIFDTPKEGEDVVLRLMFRPMGSLIAVPSDTCGLTKQTFDDLPSADMEHISRYSRLIKGTPTYAMEEYEREVAQLLVSKQDNAALFDDNGKFYDEAIETILEIQKIIGDKPSAADDYQDYAPSTPQSNWDNEEASGPPVEKMAQLGVNQETIVSRYGDDSAYFFYQAGFDTVVKYFLAPLDVKVLRAAYGAFCAFPPTLLLRVINVLHGTTVNSDLRKRIKYLNHLPLHTPIAFFGVRVAGVISDEVLKPFNKELANRRKKKKDKERREELDRKRYEREEEEHLRAELSEEYSPFYAAPAVAAASKKAANSHNKELPAASTARVDPAVSSSSSDQTSFASIASGEAQAGQDLRELESLLSSAPKKKGKGKQKFVLLSNGNGHK